MYVSRFEIRGCIKNDFEGGVAYDINDRGTVVSTCDDVEGKQPQAQQQLLQSNPSDKIQKNSRL
jgi:hypothetical protein